jgi:hypothetical protein
MKKDILERYPNGNLKHQINYYASGNIYCEYFYNQNEEYHRDNNLPAVQEWYPNVKLNYKGYYNNNCLHNIYNPSCVHMNGIRKIIGKSYYLNDNYYSNNKLNWQNCIKEI